MREPPADIAERLWAVSDQFLALGHDVKVDELAELTGVPRATLYYYFAGKGDILAFLLAQKLQRGTAAVADAVRGAGSPAERLAAVLRAMLRVMAEQPALCTRLLCSIVSEGDGQVMVEAERTLMAPVRELLVEGQASGEFTTVDATDTTTSLMGATSFVAMRHTLEGHFDPEAVADRLVPQLLHGLCTQPRPTHSRRGSDRPDQ
jgi:TetR/AcrR family transcriptional regulator